MVAHFTLRTFGIIRNFDLWKAYDYIERVVQARKRKDIFTCATCSKPPSYISTMIIYMKGLAISPGFAPPLKLFRVILCESAICIQQVEEGGGDSSKFLNNIRVYKIGEGIILIRIFPRFLCKMAHYLNTSIFMT